MTTTRIEERKARDRQARRAQIISAARQIAESEGWSSVTVRRLSDQISYSQPVLYSHFRNRDGIISAVAVDGFQELGLLLEKARTQAEPGNSVFAVAVAYLDFAVASPALYEAMFSLSLSIPFGDSSTPSELRFGFSQVYALFSERGPQAEVLAELFWASLHGVADLSRNARLPPHRQQERLRALVEVFSFAGGTAAQVEKEHDQTRLTE